MVRRAKIKDVPQLIKLVNHYANKGEMLSRSLSQVYNSIRDYVVIEENNQVVACGALHVVWDNIGEIRTVAVSPERIGQGLGRQIVEYLVKDAYVLELPQVFTLTYKPAFFEKLGFSLVDKKDLPHKVWQDCLNCPKFPDCDEIALARPINNF
ncbi:N-acetyltransferase [candidate division KSB1 bacterium]|nr:N-acetyltransferase [candidate division KSB1 bacterium]